MAPRRSTRIANKVQAVPQTAEVEPSLKKRKSSLDRADEGETSRGKKKGTLNPIAFINANTETGDRFKGRASENGDSRPRQPVPEDVLSVLPAEIQQNILSNIGDAPTMIKLASTSKRYCSLVMPLVHNHIAVKVSYFSHIPNVIRLLEPHLSVAQKKQLKKEGKYNGQQSRYSTLLNPDSVPGCAQYVRQMTCVGIDPGKKHKGIIVRYLEEVLKNLDNLEVLDTAELTESMASSIVALKNLKALRLWFSSCSGTDGSIKTHDATPLARLCNLKHLAINRGCSCPTTIWGGDTLQSILINSISTLESLELHSMRWDPSFFEKWEDLVKAHHPNITQMPSAFIALRSLALHGPSWGGNYGSHLPNITTTVDFLQLSELKLMQLEDGRLTLFKYLEQLFSKAEKGSIRLKKLTLDMDAKQPNPMTSEVHMEGIYRFIESFDNLTSLEFHNHNVFPGNIVNNPGISRRLQRVAIKHRDLESLRFRYTNRNDSPYVSAKTVRVLTKNLPQLRVLEFPLEEKDFDAMARSISHARHLETLIFPTFSSWNKHIDNAVAKLLRKVTESLLHVVHNNGEFVWEKVYSLNQIVVGCESFAVSSVLNPAYDQKRHNRFIKDGKSVRLQAMRVAESTKRSYHTAPSQWASQIMASVK